MQRRRRVGIREIAEALNIFYGSIQHILVNVWVLSILELKDLSLLQKQR